MSEDYFETPVRRPASHYHGDLVRILFVVAALLIFLTEFIGSSLPFPPSGLIGIILILIVAAGITNPAQQWIHWFNMLTSITGLMIFGGITLGNIKPGSGLAPQDMLIAAVAVLFMVSIYFATRTVRGLMVPHDPTVDPR